MTTFQNVYFVASICAQFSSRPITQHLFLLLSLFLPFIQGIPDDQVDLSREIAFNLSLIYQASGNMNMAQQIIQTHCVV